MVGLFKRPSPMGTNSESRKGKMKLFLTILLSALVTITSSIITANGCFEVEREALLTFKANLHDPGNLMSSWHGQDCCNWSGVTCDRITDHVLKLNLSNPYASYNSYNSSDWVSPALTGNLAPTLLSLHHLTHLDLSNNNFSNLSIPKFFGSFKNLIYLNLSSSRFQGVIPSELGNLSRLQFLDLSYNSFYSTLPNWLWNLTNLLYLDLSDSKFHGIIPSTLSNLTHVNYLSIGGNNFEPVILEPISKLSNLRSLDLSLLEIGGDIVNLIKSLGSIWYELEVVRLRETNLSGNMSSWIAQMKNLSIIDLSRNALSGHITSEIGTLVQLKELDLSHNFFSGAITEVHFVNLSKLEVLDLSNNMLEMKINDKWVPPFQLRYLHLDSCKIGPRFPEWLRSQTRLLNLGLSNASIASVIPTWFWNLTLENIDLSHNSISGNLPASFELSTIIILDLSSNYISGSLPSAWGAQMSYLDLSDNNISGPFPVMLQFPSARILSLSNNKINGSITYGLCGMQNLIVLDLSLNAISGDIPICWGNLSKLEEIDLCHNQITGELHASIGSLQYLITLQLYSNKLHGEIPSTLQHCKNLVSLSLGRNNFSGEIPAWIGKQLKNLAVLQLRYNKFSGYISTELGELAELQIFDLSNNYLEGPIPSSVGNFSGMKNSSHFFNSSVDFFVGSYEETLDMDINGEQVYTSRPLDYVKAIDISGNKLNGHIPKEIWLLNGLIYLNLSRNGLIGEISETIGGMRSLESLDLSFNNFSGPIPQAMSILFSLHNLNLSYNNFSGKIPTGRQLDTISDSSIYVGNPYLCGYPIKSCIKDQASINFVHDDNGREMLWFNLALVLGFILGLWSVGVVLIFQNSWNVAYFQMVDRLFDKIYVLAGLAVRRLGWWQCHNRIHSEYVVQCFVSQ